MASTNIQTFPGKVGVSNTNPIHTLDIGSNVYIDDAADTKVRVMGNIHASGITVDGNITVIETDNLSVKDPVLLLASGSTGTSDTGIIMKRADGDANVAVFYDEGVGLKICHTMSSGDEIHLTADTANALSTTVYGPVTIENTGVQSLSVSGGAQINKTLQIGTIANLYVDTTTSNVGIGTDAPAYKLDIHGTANVGTLTVTSVSGNGSGLSQIQSSNVSDFASNVTRIGTLETSNGHIWSNLASNVTRIENLETSNGHIWSNLASNVTRIENLETSNGHIWSNLASNVTRIENLETSNGHIWSNLASNVTRIENLETSNGHIWSNLASNVTRIENLETSNGHIWSNLASNVTRIENLETSNGHIWSNLASNVTRIENLETSNGHIWSNLASNVTRIENLETSNGHIWSNLASNVTRIENLE